MHKLFTSMGLAAVLAAGSVNAAESPAKVGVVNFATCITDSKHGKQEQSEFEKMAKQIASLVDDAKKQYQEIEGKLADRDFLDGLSPDAQKEMEQKRDMIAEEIGRYQQQYYQVMQQANMRLFQTMSGHINAAAEKVASSKHLNMVMNKEMCFFYTPSLDVTAEVIKEMDKAFDQDAKAQTAAAEAPAASTEAKK